MCDGALGTLVSIVVLLVHGHPFDISARGSQDSPG